jgi:hypothetical protein
MPSSPTPDPVATILARVERSRRREIERELRAHLEDAGAGNFGDPEEIAHAFAEAYRSPWRSNLRLFAASAVVSACIVAAARLFLAQRYPYLGREILFFAALPLGYIAARVSGRLATIGALALYVAAAVHVIAPGEATGPTVTFIAGAVVYLLQRARIRFAWIWGTALPLAIARVVHGPFLPGHGPFGPWHVGVWLVTALSCWAMTMLADPSPRERRRWPPTPPSSAATSRRP